MTVTLHCIWLLLLFVNERLCVLCEIRNEAEEKFKDLYIVIQRHRYTTLTEISKII